jgi:uncharacterized protein DUF7003
MLFLLILVLTVICSYFLPWWFMAIIAFVIAGLIGKKPGKTFLAGFGAVFVAWAILALLKTIPNDNRLADRVAQLFQLPNWIVLLIVTAFIGGLVGGMAALSGNIVKESFCKITAVLSESQILDTLDHPEKIGGYGHFASLGDPNSYLVDCRLNVFRGDNDQWAVVFERLGFNPRSGAIELEINYHGNCLVNLEKYNNEFSNYYVVYPLDEGNLDRTTDGFHLNKDAGCWSVRGIKIPLSTNRKDYENAGIILNDPGKISIEEAARLVVINYRDAFRATDKELYKSIPGNLKKLLVLDEWYHKDYLQVDNESFSSDQLKNIYDFNQMHLNGIDYNTFVDLMHQKNVQNSDFNSQQDAENRPGTYETWQQIAKVIATGDALHYKPTLPANTHWKHWPDSGSL